jgi:hypothetical protein
MTLLLLASLVTLVLGNAVCLFSPGKGGSDSRCLYKYNKSPGGDKCSVSQQVAAPVAAPAGAAAAAVVAAALNMPVESVSMMSGSSAWLLRLLLWLLLLALWLLLRLLPLVVVPAADLLGYGILCNKIAFNKVHKSLI